VWSGRLRSLLFFAVATDTLARAQRAQHRRLKGFRIAGSGARAAGCRAQVWTKAVCFLVEKLDLIRVKFLF